MSESSSIYLPKELKKRLIKAAQREGFEVGVGRHSGLARFLEMMVESTLNSRNNPAESTLHRLIPELQTSITELSRVGVAKQKVAHRVLKPLLTDWQGEENLFSANLDDQGGEDE